MSNRKENTEWFLGLIDELQPGNQNVEMYRQYLNDLSDEAYNELMAKLANGETVLPYYAPNLAAQDVAKEKALAVGDKLGLDLFQQLWITDPVTNVRYLTPEEYLVVHLPVRRQSQHVTKGKSVTENSKYTDALTGQPAGASRSSRLSLPEIMNLESMGLHKAIEEMISVRGGNELGFREAKRSVLDTGTYRLEDIKALGTRPTSTETLKSFLLGMHFDSNL